MSSKNVKKEGHSSPPKQQSTLAMPKLGPLLPPTLSTTSQAYAEYVKAYEIYRSTIQGYREKATERVRSQHSARREKKQGNLVKATLQELNAVRKTKGLEPIAVQFGDMPPQVEFLGKAAMCAAKKFGAGPGFDQQRARACNADKLCKFCSEAYAKATEGIIEPAKLNVKQLDEENFTLVVEKRKARAAARKAKQAAKQRAAIERAKAAKAEDKPVAAERKLKQLKLASATRAHVQKAAATLAKEYAAVKDVKERNKLYTKRIEALRAKRQLIKAADRTKVQEMFLGTLVGFGVPVQHAKREAQGRSKRELNELLRRGAPPIPANLLSRM
jgi:hypothetical protein